MNYKLWAAAMALLAAAAFAPAQVFAQDSSSNNSYQIGEGAPDTGQPGDGTSVGTDPSTTGQGPVRLARFSFISGDVTWRGDDSSEWSPAAINMPLRQGAEIWITRGRAEIQFDDGSLLRLGRGAVASVQTLYSDSQGEFTEIKLNEGLAALRLMHSDSVFQVDTPFVSVKSSGEAKLRVGVDNSVEISVQDGSAAIDGQSGTTNLQAGAYLDLESQDAAYNVGPIPDADSWDRWNDARDAQLADADTRRCLPSDISLVSGNLDEYGTWHNDPQYGHVWCPLVSDDSWRPYEYGHWVWVSPFGWTWVSTEPWGWAPYHYGTWIRLNYGWSWVPGPAHQYWCPGAVQFTSYGNQCDWVPLAPQDVHYPTTLSIGFRHGDWALSFSIGGCGVYYANGNSCEARPWSNKYVNRTVYVNNVTNVYNTTIVNNSQATYVHNTFVPFNARNGQGVTGASYAEFGGQGQYHAVNTQSASIFQRGGTIGLAPGEKRPLAGPVFIHPTVASTTPTRTFSPVQHVDTGLSNRPVFRSALPQAVATFAVRSQQPSANRPSAFVAPRRPLTTNVQPAPARSQPPTRQYGNFGGSNQAEDPTRPAPVVRTPVNEGNTGGFNPNGGNASSPQPFRPQNPQTVPNRNVFQGAGNPTRTPAAATRNPFQGNYRYNENSDVTAGRHAPVQLSPTRQSNTNHANGNGNTQKPAGNQGGSSNSNSSGNNQSNR